MKLKTRIKNGKIVKILLFSISSLKFIKESLIGTFFAKLKNLSKLTEFPINGSDIGKLLISSLSIFHFE